MKKIKKFLKKYFFKRKLIEIKKKDLWISIKQGQDTLSSFTDYFDGEHTFRIYDLKIYPSTPGAHIKNNNNE